MKLRDELDECFGCGDLPRVERALKRAKKAPAAEQSALFMPMKMLEKYADNLRGTGQAPRRRRGARAPPRRRGAMGLTNSHSGARVGRIR